MNDDRIAQLERLAKLRDSGVLTDEELAAEKLLVLSATDRNVERERSTDLPDRPSNLSPAQNPRWLKPGLYSASAVLVALIGFAVWNGVKQEPAPPVQQVSLPPPTIATTVEMPQGGPEAAPSPIAASPAPPSVRSVPPNIVGEWRTFRTRIRDGWGTEPDFAGRYVIIRMGCGGGCTSGIVGDHQTGELYDLGLGGEEQMYLNLDYGVGSNVIKARWDDYQNCFSQDFSWTGTRLTPLGEPQISPRGDEPCDMSY